MATHTNTAFKLGAFSLVMITVGSVDSIRNLPATALFGSELIFFFLSAALFFLLPVAFISAELASIHKLKGGVYSWVKAAFGPKLALMAIWLQWIENVIWYPTLLSFVAGTIGYLIDPSLVENKSFLIAIILSAFWGTTFINLSGMQSSARFANICTIFGLLLPMALIIGLGVVWIGQGYPIAIDFSAKAMIPRFSDTTVWISLTGIMLSFCGMEIAAVHASDVRDPHLVYPRVMRYSVFIIVATLLLGSLSLAMVIPHDDISLVAGIMQAFDAFFSAYGLYWLLPIIGLMLVIGGLGSVNNWLIAPARGLLVAAQDGHMPKSLQGVNANGAPKALLLTQALIVSVLTLVFLLLPAVNASYWLLTALASQLYMIMYVIMFISALVLRFQKNPLTRAYQIPGGNWGIVVVASMGMLSAIVTLLVGFIPPTEFGQLDSIWLYESLLVGGLVLMCLPPFLSFRHRKASWQPTAVSAET